MEEIKYYFKNIYSIKNLNYLKFLKLQYTYFTTIY